MAKDTRELDEGDQGEELWDKTQAKPEILVLGSAGQVGCELMRQLGYANMADIVLSRPRELLNIADHEKVQALIEGIRPRLVINLAATNPYRVNDDREHWNTNAKAVSHLVKMCALNEAAFIHLSTVDVFEGDGHYLPYMEYDPISPESAYARSKAAGEHAILAVAQYPAPEFVNFKYWILRTALLYESPTRYYHNAMQLYLNQAMRTRDHLPLPGDVQCSTTYVPHLVQQLIWLINSYKSVPNGLYHVANAGETSIYNWIRYALQHCSNRVTIDNVKRCSRKEFIRWHGSKDAGIPCQNQSLNCKAWDDICPIAMPSWQEAVAEFSQVYKQLQV